MSAASSPPLVARTIARTRAYPMPEGVLPEDKPLLSKNRIVGWTVNVPIYPTCQPTKVCIKTCYYARGATAAPNNLEKQTLVMRLIQRDPVAAAKRIVRELREAGAEWLRWNGGGDLFPEAVACINEVAREAPDIPLWIVTRKPFVAAGIVDAPSVYVHLSLDATSHDRLRAWLALPSKTTRWFASYQEARGENVDTVALSAAGFSVVFRDNYKGKPEGGASCPLNGAASIVGGCERCRRCWSQEAVDMRNEEALRAWSEEP